ncbi:MAG: rRNA maturation RNase YbeY [Candidatus Taylorbacteria bacterium]|nr:rRNA maturation RNase YbeY [Candidatus Taylorbacteria bacterium]
MAQISISNETRAQIPTRALFHAITTAILPKTYNLNLVFVNSSEISKLNKIYRNKGKPTDILSFPLGKNEGEIYVCPSEARKESKKFSRSYANFIPFLFIHGCVHLKGYDHGGTMERIEAKVRLKFKL